MKVAPNTWLSFILALSALTAAQTADAREDASAGTAGNELESRLARIAATLQARERQLPLDFLDRPETETARWIKGSRGGFVNRGGGGFVNQRRTWGDRRGGFLNRPYRGGGFLNR